MMGLFGKKLTCTCGCGCKQIYKEYGDRIMYILAEEAWKKYQLNWKGDYTICERCNSNQHLNEIKKEKSNATRRGWTEIQKEQVRMKQNGICNMCSRPPPRWEYHHVDGDPSNNDIRNCEGLCPNCHSVKTHE